VRRPAGLKLDSGGIVKGLAADLVAEHVVGDGDVAIDCAGDLRVRGTTPREVRVADPFADGRIGRILHRFELADGGVATSGIGRRSWIGADGRPAHHLLDPSTGRPAYTGVVQATALAPTAVEAEVLAKAALLEGPERGAQRLIHGGVLVLDDGGHQVVAPPPISQQRPSDALGCAHPASRG
jgi:thiamine biosynthesis lipoprotein